MQGEATGEDSYEATFKVAGERPKTVMVDSIIHAKELANEWAGEKAVKILVPALDYEIEMGGWNE